MMGVQKGSPMSKTSTPMVCVRLPRSERAKRFGRYPNFFAVASIRSFVTLGMYRASGASFRTMETVEEEKPLCLATSRIVTRELPVSEVPALELPTLLLLVRFLQEVPKGTSCRSNPTRKSPLAQAARSAHDAHPWAAGTCRR